MCSQGRVQVGAGKVFLAGSISPAPMQEDNTMKTISATALAALMTASVAFAAIPAQAQDAPPPPAGTEMPGGHGPGHGPRPGGPGMNHDGGPRRGGLGGDLLDFRGGSEAIEIALVRLSHRIEMTPEQQTLFDTLRTDALAAADTLETTLEAARPDRAAGTDAATTERPSFSERLQTRIALEQARLDALKTVEPSLTAFFDSLTEDQLASMMPRRDRAGMGKGMDGAPAPMDLPAPDADAAPEAPAVDDATAPAV
jgi:hypothetical protein